MNYKSIKTISFILFSFLLVVSCEKVNNKTETVSNSNELEDNQDIKEKMGKIKSDVEKIMLAGNYNDLLPFYTENIIIDPGFHPSVKGKKAIKEIYEGNKKIGLKHHSFSGIPEDIWECEKFIYERGKFGMSVSSKDHQKPLAYYGSYFTIWKKVDDGSLKIKYVIWNLDFNPYK